MNHINEIKNIKDLVLKKENIFFIIFIIATFTLDRVSKVKILNEFNDMVYFINDFINLDLIWNIGIGFGFLSSEISLLYNSITVVIGLVILILLFFSIKSEIFDKLIFSIIIGGACGNFYDRLIYNAVPDFIDVHYNNFHWFTFNVADIFITLGILIFLMKNFFTKN